MNSSITFPGNLNFDAVLTSREEQITEVLAMGHSRKEVPDFVAPTRKGTPVSINTVIHTSKSIYRKTGAQKAAELTIWWFVRKYNIPVGILLLFLLFFSEFAPVPAAMRARTKIIEYRTGQLRRRSEDNNTDYIFES